MAEPKKQKKGRGRPKIPQPKRQIVSLRGSEKWRDWLNGMADKEGMPTTVLVVQALKLYAEAKGYEEMPKR